MTSKRVGNFLVDVSSPHPVWIEIKYMVDDLHENHNFRFSHHELRDLEYAVASAIRDAIALLPEGRRHEV